MVAVVVDDDAVVVLFVFDVVVDAVVLSPVSIYFRQPINLHCQ